MNQNHPHGQSAVPKEDAVPARGWMRFGAFVIGVLLCWLYAEFFATDVANGYDDWMKSDGDGHFFWTFLLGFGIVLAGVFAFVKANGSHKRGIIISSALYVLVAFMPLWGAVGVLFPQHLAR